MIESFTKKIMTGGIVKYAKIYEVDENDIQIRLTLGEEENTLNYEIFKKWRKQEDITFLNILNKKVDFFQYEALSTPYMVKSIKHFSKEFNADENEVSIFLVKIKSRIIVVVYIGTNSVTSHTLHEQFEKIPV